MKEPKKIFIAALDWGLGHASRCIPLINCLLKRGYHITIGGTGNSGILLKKEFPEIPYIEIPGYSPRFAEGKIKVRTLVYNFPLLVLMSFREYFFVRKLHKRIKFDFIISDHRYGIRARKAENIMIIHQLRYKAPGILKPLGGLSFSIHKLLLAPYDQIWIPDFKMEPNFSGDLSHHLKLGPKFRYIGLLSRFEGEFHPEHSLKKHILVLISGPEPQRHNFENLIIRQFANYPKSVVIVAGQPSEDTQNGISTQMIRFSHLPANPLCELIKNAELIISRSGYSTIMDLAVLGTKALFIPTPGQPEQEYLAQLMMKSGYAFSVDQHLFDVNQHIDKAIEYQGFDSRMIKNNLCETVDVLMSGN